MSEGPGRRIKRSVFLDSASVRFLTSEEVDLMVEATRDAILNGPVKESAETESAAA